MTSKHHAVQLNALHGLYGRCHSQAEKKPQHGTWTCMQRTGSNLPPGAVAVTLRRTSGTCTCVRTQRKAYIASRADADAKLCYTVDHTSKHDTPLLRYTITATRGLTLTLRSTITATRGHNAT
eukprot:TRINITY_DN4679_c0_g2_i1.p1 TRINITY_DN4679_c0_g2~~TRINITY_DN4679_c0_g2_i1.p1  ORF type:complete len:123 (-),score=8.23 TRINITY_DN4679_c0_g2_i1:909-1277(-)